MLTLIRPLGKARRRECQKECKRGERDNFFHGSVPLPWSPVSSLYTFSLHTYGQALVLSWLPHGPFSFLIYPGHHCFFRSISGGKGKPHICLNVALKYSHPFCISRTDPVLGLSVSFYPTREIETSTTPIKTAMAPKISQRLTCSKFCTNRREIRIEKKGEV